MAGHVHVHLDDKAAAGQTARKLKLAVGLTVLFVVIEATAGYFAHSLALISDAGHNLTDALALGITLWTFGLASAPATARRTYGLHRAGILGALLNATTLVVLAGGILVEAYVRLREPEIVNASIVTGVAALALAVNLAIAFGLHGAAKHDVNVRASFTHVAGDAASAASVVIVGLVISYAGLMWLDPLVSVLIALFILWTSREILIETVNILLESTPSDLDAKSVQQAMCAVPGVLDVHDLHLWSVSSTLRAASAHVLVEDQPVSKACDVLSAVNEMLAHRFLIAHSSLQLETSACDPGSVFCQLHTHAAASGCHDLAADDRAEESA